MKTRVLVLDDDSDGLDNLCGEIRHAMSLHPAELGEAEIIPHNTSAGTEDEIIQAVEKKSSEERWDAILVDVQHSQQPTPTLPTLLLPIKIIEKFREYNKTSLAFIFSGTMQKHLRKLLDFPTTADAAPTDRSEIERGIRFLFSEEVQGFHGRDKIARNLLNRLFHPPWQLRLEREFLKNPSTTVEGLALPGVRSGALSFKEVALDIRRGNPQGNAILKAACEYGVAAIAEIASLQDRQLHPWFCVTADCEDLSFLVAELEVLEKEMPKVKKIVLASGESPHESLTAVAQDTEVKVVAIMLHGGEGYLLGGDRSSSSFMAANAVKWMDSPEHHATLRGKVVYCFACKSVSLAKVVIEAGAIAFIGFPDIPFYRFNERGEPVLEEALTSALQVLYGKLTRCVLLKLFEGSIPLDELVDYIQLSVKSLSLEFVRAYPDHPFKAEVVSMFGKIAAGVELHGDGAWIFPGT